MEILKTDPTFWEIGPYDTILPGPMRLRLRLDGEVVVAAETEIGFLHKGFEKLFEQLSWRATIPYVDRLDPEGAAFSELVLCQCVEEIAEIQVPPRAQAIRVILCELNRVSSHMDYIIHLAKAVGSDTMVHYLLRDREKILDLFELVTGARFAFSYFRFGGVKSDISEGFVERVLEFCELMRIRLKEYNDLFTYNHAFVKRTGGIGVLSLSMVKQLGISGPNARASGWGGDVRRSAPYSGYDKIDFKIPVGTEESALTDEALLGDCRCRFLTRLREIGVSTEVLRQASDEVPAGDYCFGKPEVVPKIPAGEAYSRVESARGTLGCHLVSDGGERPVRVQFSTPSAKSIRAIPTLLSGARLEDVPVALASLGLSISEADR